MHTSMIKPDMSKVSNFDAVLMSANYVMWKSAPYVSADLIKESDKWTVDDCRLYYLILRENGYVLKRGVMVDDRPRDLYVNGLFAALQGVPTLGVSFKVPDQATVRSIFKMPVVTAESQFNSI